LEDPSSFLKEQMSCEGAEQGMNLGNFNSASECAPAAFTAGCEIFMHAPIDTSWGCRCCNSWEGLTPHDYWTTFATSNFDN